MGDSKVGQQSETQKSSAIETPDGTIEEGTFLGPEETDRMLSALEEIDRNVLGGGEGDSSGEEGIFISPEDIEEPEAGSLPEDGISAPQSPARPRGTEPSPGGEFRQPDLLSRIAGELRSIKSEIGTLKNTYDDMMTKASSIAADAELRREGQDSPATAQASAPAHAPVPPESGRLVPEETLAELKKLLGYMDRLLEALPEEKIDEFARSEYFELYRKIFEFFGLV